MYSLLYLLGAWTAPAHEAIVPFYDEESARELAPPRALRTDAYFGFSTTYDQFNDRVIIGAPRENNIGAVYQCETRTKLCSQLGHDIKRHGSKRYKHEYWFGATVRAGSDFLVACAPRLTTLYKNNSNITINAGQCYHRKKGNTKFEAKLKIQYPMANAYIETNMETLGWALDVAPDDSVIVGGPAMFRKQGVAALSFLETKSHKTGGNVTWQLIERTSLPYEPAYNFGYNVASGYFINENELSYAVSSTYGYHGLGKVYFYCHNGGVLSGPKELERGEDWESVGSMYGAALCAVRLRSPSALARSSDLLVGAPTYAGRSGYDVGAVYVYMFHKGAEIAARVFSNSKRFYEELQVNYVAVRPSEVIVPIFSKAKALFNINIKWKSYGAVLLCDVADDNDAHRDIAIGAPYEDESRGAVYVYCGGSILNSGARPTWRQRLQPAARRSFGYSLTAITHHDTGCAGLAVGAPYDDRVLVYRCAAVVLVSRVAAHFHDLQNRNDPDTTEYEFQVCIDVTYLSKPTKINAILSTDVEIIHPHASLPRANKPFGIFSFNTQISLQHKERQYCKQLQLHVPADGDYSVEIGYKISTELDKTWTRRNNAEGERVVLSDVSELVHFGAVWAPAAAGCARASRHHLTLSVTTSFMNYNASAPFVIGSSERGTVSIEVFNSGNASRDPYLRVAAPPAAVRVGTLPADCATLNHFENTIECTATELLKVNEKWQLDIVVELDALTNRDTNITLNVTLFDGCSDSGYSAESGEHVPAARRHIHVVPLRSAVEGLQLTGATSIGDIVYMTKQELIYNGKQLEHIYMIVNKGPTKFVDILAQIKLEKQTYIRYSIIPASYYIVSSSNRRQIEKSCEPVSETASELTIECRIESLAKHDIVKIAAFMSIVPGARGYITYQTHTLSANSVLSIQSLGQLITSERISTIIQQQEPVQDVNVQAYMTGGAVGLSLLFVIILLLNRGDCLRRRKKEELVIAKIDIQQRKSICSSQLHSSHM